MNKEALVKSKQEEIREGIRKHLETYRHEFGDEVLAGILMDYLHSQGVVIKGYNLEVTHPHLANYFTVSPLIE